MWASRICSKTLVSKQSVKVSWECPDVTARAESSPLVLTFYRRSCMTFRIPISNFHKDDEDRLPFQICHCNYCCDFHHNWMNHVTFWPLTAAVNNPIKKWASAKLWWLSVSQTAALVGCLLCALLRIHQKWFNEKTEEAGVKVHWCTKKGRWSSQPEEITRVKLLKKCFASHKWLFLLFMAPGCTMGRKQMLCATFCSETWLLLLWQVPLTETLLQTDHTLSWKCYWLVP